jgi:hypothetical protein
MTGVIPSVREYRIAARRIVRTDQRSVQDRCLALVKLNAQARSEPDTTLRHWAERVIWEESREFFGAGEAAPRTPNFAYLHAQRKLRSKGLDTCPTCLGVVANGDDFERWRMLEGDRMDELQRREQAVQDATA